MANPLGFRVAARQGVSYAFMNGINNFIMKIKDIVKSEDIIREIKAFRKKQLEESGTPEVGIFYVIGDEKTGENEVIVKGDPARALEPIGKFKIYMRDDHFNWWYKDLVKHNNVARNLYKNFDLDKNGKQVRKISYFFLPRGRVVCLANNTNFTVFCDEHVVNDEKLKAMVRSEMSLSFDTPFKIDSDAHYECYHCNPLPFHKSVRIV